jgi:putative nucleotidyltransferase with HDIG domain
MIDRLPGLSTTVLKVLETCNDPNSTANDLNRVISLDPVLTGRVLKLVNSAYYGIAHTISSVTRAVVMLGLNTVKQLSLSLAILENFYSRHSFPAFSADQFWSHSLCVAAAAKSLAAATGVPLSDHEEYFVAGLLHDLGKIPLHKVAPQEGAEAVRLACDKSWPLPVAETAVLGVDHGTIGHLIATKWRLSPRVADSIGSHHAVKSVPEAHRPFVRVVAFANRFANIGRIGFAGDCVVNDCGTEGWLKAIGLENEVLEALHAAVSDEYEKACIFLDVASGKEFHAG